ncbi:hypothetical protein SDC9_210392 [bioreactor metagenome]|uniref:Uncharacterized protein n=1 Tax=bioreactor metagenome TaxID=1076179 RepID=A0A645JHR3_9ZZZZ
MGRRCAASTARAARAISASAARRRTCTLPSCCSSSGSCAALFTPASIQGRACSRMNGRAACSAPWPMPASSAAWMICANGPMVLGCSNEAVNGTTHSGATRTRSNCTEPLPVTRWPKPSQSSTTVTPGALRGTNTRYWRSPCASCALTRVGIQCAKMAPVQ